MYQRYAQDLGKLMKKLIHHFEGEEHQLREFYENQVSELSSELKRYQTLISNTEIVDPKVPQQQFLSNEKMKWVTKKKLKLRI